MFRERLQQPIEPTHAAMLITVRGLVVIVPISLALLLAAWVLGDGPQPTEPTIITEPPTERHKPPAYGEPPRIQL